MEIMLVGSTGSAAALSLVLSLLAIGAWTTLSAGGESYAGIRNLFRFLAVSFAVVVALAFINVAIGQSSSLALF